ncbi:MAG: hypothetical protein ABSD42_12450 [Candidatus Bathyarchaeia archaeon]
MPKTPMFMEFERGSKIRDTVIKEDKLLEDILRTLGFKPGQIFSLQELPDKARLFYKVATKEELDRVFEETFPNDEDDFAGAIVDLSNSDLLEKYYRFIPENEIKELKELRGERGRTSRPF